MWIQIQRRFFPNFALATPVPLRSQTGSKELFTVYRHAEPPPENRPHIPPWQSEMRIFEVYLPSKYRTLAPHHPACRRFDIRTKCSGADTNNANIIDYIRLRFYAILQKIPASAQPTINPLPPPRAGHLFTDLFIFAKGTLACSLTSKSAHDLPVALPFW